jgi:cullin 3
VPSFSFKGFKKDRVYTKTADVPETWSKGLELFLKHIIKSPIKGHLMTAILKQVKYERDGYVINRSAVKGCVDVFLSLDVDADGSTTVYKLDFEPLFLKESENFYKAEADYLLTTCDASEYLRRVCLLSQYEMGIYLFCFTFFQVDARFVSEDSRTHHYLSRQTSPLLKQILENRLLTPHLVTVVSMPNSGLDVMIDADKIEDLARLYRLYKMVPEGLPCLRRSLKESIARRGKEINDTSLGADSFDVNVGGEGDRGKAKARPPNAGALPAIKWVQDVLDLIDKFDSLWKRAFDNDREIESSLNEVSYLACATLETQGNGT